MQYEEIIYTIYYDIQWYVALGTSAQMILSIFSFSVLEN